MAVPEFDLTGASMVEVWIIYVESDLAIFMKMRKLSFWSIKKYGSAAVKGGFLAVTWPVLFLQNRRRAFLHAVKSKKLRHEFSERKWLPKFSHCVLYFGKKRWRKLSDNVRQAQFLINRNLFNTSRTIHLTVQVSITKQRSPSTGCMPVYAFGIQDLVKTRTYIRVKIY